MNAGQLDSLALSRRSAGRRALLLGAASCPWVLANAQQPPPDSVGRVLTVGPGAQYSGLQAALAAARDGDRIDLLPGTYRQPATEVTGRLHLRGLGDGAVLQADGNLAGAKGILVVSGDVTVENMGFTGARRAHGNGAGIRFMQGKLQVRGCNFWDNEMGLLGSDHPEAELRLQDSVFRAAPRHRGQLHHLLYASTMARLEVEGCRFEGGWRGHLIKSRARQNIVRYNLLRDGLGGEASYELELAEGGHNLVLGNVIAQAPGTQNRSIVAVGYNANPQLTHSLVFAYNTVVNQAWWPARFLRIWEQNMPQAKAMVVAHNVFAGRGDPKMPRTMAATGNVHLTLDQVEDAAAQLFQARLGCLAVQTASSGWATEWLPQRQFKAPVGTRPRTTQTCAGAVEG
jgi:hypothetical protein